MKLGPISYQRREEAEAEEEFDRIELGQQLNRSMAEAHSPRLLGCHA